MASAKQIKFYIDLSRELFVLRRISRGLDDDRPSRDVLAKEVEKLDTEDATAAITTLQRAIHDVRSEYRITRWIDADGVHRSVPREWP